MPEAPFPRHAPCARHSNCWLGPRWMSPWWNAPVRTPWYPTIHPLIPAHTSLGGLCAHDIHMHQSCGRMGAYRRWYATWSFWRVTPGFPTPDLVQCEFSPSAALSLLSRRWIHFSVAFIAHVTSCRAPIPTPWGGATQLRPGHSLPLGLPLKVQNCTAGAVRPQGHPELLVRGTILKA